MFSKEELREILPSKYVPAEQLKEKVISNALRYATGCKREDIVAIYDTTIFSNGKSGFLLSTSFLYNKDFSFLIPKESAVNKIPLEGMESYEKAEKDKENISIRYRDGSKILVYTGKVYQQEVTAILDGAIRLEKERHAKAVTEQESGQACDTDGQKVKINETIERGRTVCFGKYANPEFSDPETLHWDVVDVREDKALLVSSEILAVSKYCLYQDDISWKNSMVRRFLNEEFLENAFTEQERDAILTTRIPTSDNPDYCVRTEEGTEDKIFILSVEEVLKYLNPDKPEDIERKEHEFYGEEQRWYKMNTAFVDKEPSMDVYYEKDLDLLESCPWWLRTPGKENTYISTIDCAARVDVCGEEVENELGICPALWVALDKISCKGIEVNEELKGYDFKKVEKVKPKKKEQIEESVTVLKESKPEKTEESVPVLKESKPEKIEKSEIKQTENKIIEEVSETKGFTESDELRENQPEKVKLKGKIKKGDIIYFGRYYQDETEQLEELPWEVLEVDEEKEKALLLTRDIIDFAVYQSDWRKTKALWSESSIREKLNKKFLEEAFTEVERNTILTTHIMPSTTMEYGFSSGDATDDKIFILSLQEVLKYLTPGIKIERVDLTKEPKNIMYKDAISQCKECNIDGWYMYRLDTTRLTKYLTGYMAAEGKLPKNGSWMWWLRTPGGSEERVCVVGSEGAKTISLFGIEMDVDFVGICPAMWISL